MLSCANYLGRASRSAFAGEAAYGYCGYCLSKSQYIWGMRLVLLCDRKGVPVGYDLVGPTTGQEANPSSGAAAHPGSVLLCDGGFWSADYRGQMSLIQIDLVTPDKHKLGQQPPREVAKRLSEIS